MVVNKQLRSMMAPQKVRMLSLHRQMGGASLWFIAGMTLGLVLAVVFVMGTMKEPLPFVEKVSRPAQIEPADVQAVLGNDPNESLNPAQVANVQDPALSIDSEAVEVDQITGGAASAFQLQVGAFRSAGDAEQLQAKLAMLGFEARVQQVESSGQYLNRVRLGPFGTMESLTETRARLSQYGVESSVVRQR